MTPTTALLEPSFLDLIAAIEQRRSYRGSAAGTGSAHCGKSPSGWTARPR
jgi:hypothetical protein